MKKIFLPVLVKFFKVKNFVKIWIPAHLLNHENTFLFSQCFKVSLHFFQLIIEVIHQKIDIQHQAKDYLNFKLGKLKEIHRRISTKSRQVAKFPASRGLFSLVFGGPEEKKNGWVRSRLWSCMFLLSFADLWLLYGFHWKRFVLSRFYLNPFTFVGFRNS